MKNRLLVVLSVVLVATVGIGLRVLNDSLEEGGFFSSNLFLGQASPGPNQALYFVSPSSGSHNVGDTFQVELRLAASAGVTSIKAYLNFNSSLLSATNVSSAGGAFQIYYETTSTSNQVRIQAVQPNPGISGNNNLVATVTFQAVGNGTANLTYDSSSLALKPDNSNILSIAGSTSGSYALVIPDTTPPSRSNGQPTGSLPSGTTSRPISLSTNESAACKYSTNPGVSYASMPNTFSSTGGTSHSTTVSGLSDGQSYTYYVRCRDSANNANTNDFPIAFSVDPTPDTTPPSRSNGSPSGTLSAGTTQATLQLTTDEATTCKYSTNSGVSYNSMPSMFSSTGSLSHSTVVTGLSNGQSHTYYVRCRDASNNTNTGDFPIAFSVASPTPPPDTTAPSRSNGAPTGTLSVGTAQATLQLTTDEAATCKYSTTQNISYAAMANTFSSTGGTSHSSNVTGLSNGQPYTYYIRCQDASNNANTGDFPIQFQVDAAGDTTPPQRSGNAPSGALGAGTTSTTISLVTSEIATCRYATAAGVAYSSMANTFSETDDTAHSTTASGLGNGTSYSYYVRCEDESGNENTDDFPIEFSIAAAPSGGGGGGGGGGSGGGGGGGGATPAATGDCNNDSKINIFDASILISHWARSTTTCDLNGDGTISIFDASILIRNWTG